MWLGLLHIKLGICLQGPKLTFKNCKDISSSQLCEDRITVTVSIIRDQISPCWWIVTILMHMVA